jgi:TadE-like protein
MTSHSNRRRIARWRSDSGTGLIEFALTLPLLLVILLGVVETGYMLLDQHVVTKMSREGANLISRDITLQDAVNAVRQMSGAPVNFDDGSSKVIFTVIKSGAIQGTTNYNRAILYQRISYGTYPGASVFSASGGTYSSGPDYHAMNPDSDASLRLANTPNGLLSGPGSTAYVAEIFSKHTLITPLDRLGIHLPRSLYSIAYF